MIIEYLIEINPWEKLLAENSLNLELKIGDFIVLEGDFGQELGRIIEIKEKKDKPEEKYSIINKLASFEDKKIINENNQDKEKTLKDCRGIVKKYNLDMKIIDCYFSFDDQKLSFAFIANGRIDFRDLVKELNRFFGKVIRLHQIGVRDEAKLVGDIGYCGLKQCCKTHLKKLGNVTSEFAEDQQVVHRGSERLSGTCGRLKCCLAYEEGHYQEIIKKLPPVGTKVKTEHGRGEVIGWHVLRSSVDVKINKQREEDKLVIVEIPIK